MRNSRHIPTEPRCVWCGLPEPEGEWIRVYPENRPTGLACSETCRREYLSECEANPEPFDPHEEVYCVPPIAFVVTFEEGY